MASINIYRAGRAIPITIDIDDKTVFLKKLQGAHHITSEFIHNSASALDVIIGDYITYPASGGAATGENYNINRLPEVIKINNSTFKYNIDFEANIYNLNKKIFKDGASGLTDFAYDGSPADFINKIISNINEINPTWTAATGTNSTGIDKTLQFTNESCLSALGKIAEAYKMEYDVNDKIISLQDSIAGPSGYSFEYGRENGLYKLTREPVLNQNIITRCYGFGGQTNIPDTYRNGNKRLIFAASGMAASGYLESSAATGLYGIREGVYTDDTIFPERTGTITAVDMNFDVGGLGAVARVDKITKNDTPGDCTIECNGYSHTMFWDTNAETTALGFLLDTTNYFGAITLQRVARGTSILFIAAVPGVDFAAATITAGAGTADNLNINVVGSGGTDLNSETSYIEDTSINFDINDYKIPGQTPSIVFKSGVLSGVQCEISKFDYATKRIYIKTFTDSDGYIQPNATHLPVIGDTYTLVNIVMPQTYINTAETRLQAATQKYLDENCAPHVVYTLDIDPKDARLNNISLKAGNRVTVIDSALSINKLIRISSIEYPLVDPYKIKVVLTNPIVPYTLQERLVKAAGIITKGALFSTSSPAKGMIPGANNAGAGYFLNAKGAWVVPETLTPVDMSVALSVGSTFPGAGIALSTGSAWGTSVVNNSANWNTAYTHSQIAGGDSVHVSTTENTNWDTAYTHSQSNSQAHSDYMLNTGDTATGDYAFDTDTLFIDSVNNRVGIGTANPGEKLSVYDSGTTDGVAAIFYRNVTDGIGVSIFVGKSAANGGTGIIKTFPNIATPTSARMTLGLWGDNLDVGTGLTILKGGNVGILESAPSVSLQVAGSGIKSEIVQSTTAFSSGFQGDGYKVIESDGRTKAEFDDLLIRGGLSVYELIINQLHYQNGGLIIGAGAGKVKSIHNATQGSEQMYFQTPQGTTMCPFTTGAIVMMQRVDIDRTTLVKKIVRQVSAVQADYRVDFTATAGWVPATDDTGVFAIGDELCAIGHTLTASLQNSIYLSAIDSDNPFMRVFAGVDSYAKWSLSNKSTIKLQIGNLASLANYDILPADPGYGLYSSNAYLTGRVVLPNAGMTNEGDLSTDIRIYAGDTYANRATAPFRINQAGIGVIGGWVMEPNGLWNSSGEPYWDDGYAALGITLASDGSIHSKKFFVNADGAIGILTEQPHWILKTASENLRNSHDAEASTSSQGVYVKLKTITLTNGLKGTQRFKFDIKNIEGVGSAYGQVRRNGTQIGITKEGPTSTYTTTSQDITQTWQPSDACELWGTATSGDMCYVRNFRLYYDDGATDVIAVKSVNS